MTTIAYNHKDQEIASDSLITSGGVKAGDATKLIRYRGGWAAFSGKVPDTGSIEDYLNGEDIKDLNRLEVDTIVIPDKGTPYNLWFDSIGREFKESLKGSWALGSGREFALGAMAVGASAGEAVKAAIKYDIYSGGKVVVKKKGDKE